MSDRRRKRKKEVKKEDADGDEHITIFSYQGPATVLST